MKVDPSVYTPQNKALSLLIQDAQDTGTSWDCKILDLGEGVYGIVLITGSDKAHIFHLRDDLAYVEDRYHEALARVKQR